MLATAYVVVFSTYAFLRPPNVFVTCDVVPRAISLATEVDAPVPLEFVPIATARFP